MSATVRRMHRALSECSKCGEKMPIGTTSCPHCGNNHRADVNNRGWAAIIGFIIIASIILILQRCGIM